jgi:D-glycero-D-manno-heptose 1,7-bisphosphate phosphatase
MNMKAAVFVERDGILVQTQVERNRQISPLTLAELKPNVAAREPLARLKSAGFLLIATTNQPGLSRGYQSRRELDLIHLRLRALFSLDDLFLCPHDESDRCPCRKPKPGLLTEAAFKWHIDLDRSLVISDKWQDAEAARTVGSTSLLVTSPWVGPVHHDFILPDLETVVDKIFQLSSVAHRAYA